MQFGRVGDALGRAEAVAALRGGVERVAEQQGLFGGEEVRAFRPAGGGGGAAVGEDLGGADDRVGDPGGEVGDLSGVGSLGGRGGEQRGGGDGVHRGVGPLTRRTAFVRRAPFAYREGGAAEAVPTARGPVADGGGEPGRPAEDGDPEAAVGAGPGSGLPGPAAQQGFQRGLFGGDGGVGVQQRVGLDGRPRRGQRRSGRGSGEGGAQGCSLGRVGVPTRTGGEGNRRALAPSRQVRVTYP